MTIENDVLERAWRFRKGGGWIEKDGALRVFHGPREGIGTPLERYAIDRFANWYWITEWEGDGEGFGGAKQERGDSLERARAFLVEKGASGAVFMPRPEKGVAAESTVLFGRLPEEAIEVREGRLRFGVRLLGARHPGLFLDHRPLREWLFANSRDRSVLNCFAYTGSLSVAAGVGGAKSVTTLDLSKPTIQWAERNWRLNRLATERARFIAGDVFERLPRFAKQGERFDCVILDPPSFSRGLKGSFSTARDLPKLHCFAFDCVADGGVLVTSINSANVPRAKFEAEVRQAARDTGAELEIVELISLPEFFAGPKKSGAGEDYLKGWILRVQRRSPRNPAG